MLKQVKQSKPKPKAIIFSGGSSRGYAYIGAYRYLEENNLIDNVEVVVGCSIGALFATMFLIGFKSYEMEGLMSDLDLEILRDISANSILNFLDTGGIDTGIKMVAFVESLLEIKTGRSDWTFNELHQKYKIHLILVASEIFIGYAETRLFDHLKTPELTISEAIRISASYPTYFIPINSREGKLTDGGITNNFPIDLYKYYKISLDDTLAFYLRTKRKKEKPEGADFLLNVLTSIISKESDAKYIKYKDYCILLETNTIPMDPFSCDNSIKREMIKIGYQQTRDQLILRYPWILQNKNYEGFTSVNASPSLISQLITKFESIFISKIT